MLCGASREAGLTRSKPSSLKAPSSLKTPGGTCRCVGAGLVLLAAWALATGPRPAWACDVPVFRYALERWAPDPYEITVFGPRPGGAAAAAPEPTPASQTNLRWQWVDVSRPVPPPLDELRQSLPSGHDAVLRLGHTGEPVWSGSLSAEAPAQLPLEVAHSPVREAIARHLLDGASAVWLLLESGDAARDEAAADLLKEELATLEQTLVLPIEDTGLEIAFALVRAARHDPREQVLARSLLASEWGLADSAEPMAFPVFGRGRVLYALVGSGISKANIREACAFLVGPCACEIKDGNPGFDLLLSADWSAISGDVVSAYELPSVACAVPAMAAAEGADAGQPGPVVGESEALSGDAPSGGLLSRSLGLVFLLGLVASGTATVLMYRRRR